MPIVKLKGRTKLERMDDLRRAGLNTSDFVVLKPKPPIITDKAKVLLAANSRISVRTWLTHRKWDISPHLPNITREEALLRVPELLAKGYHVSVAVGIDPGETLVCGSCWKKSPTSYAFDLAFGPGTLRRVMVEGKVEMSVFSNTRQADNPIIQEIIKTLEDFPLKRIYEWSYYMTKVGWKKKNLIFWEWQHDGTEVTY